MKFKYQVIALSVDSIFIGFETGLFIFRYFNIFIFQRYPGD